MGNALFIVWRESTEALLVVGILYAWLNKHPDVRRGMRYLWGGVATGVGLALVLAAVMLGIARLLSDQALEYFQLAMMVVASVLIVQMVFWMRQHGRTFKRELEHDMQKNARSANWWGLLIVVALAVGRESAETVVFLYGLGAQNESLGRFLTVIALGLAGAFATFWLLQKGGKVVSWRIFFRVSEIVLLLLAGALLGYNDEQWNAFNVIIQLGAILAIIVLYWRTFWAVLEGLIRGNPVSLRFVRNILIGFVPSAILGFLLINRIEALLLKPAVVAWAFILGGMAILVIEKMVKNTPVVGVADMPLKTVIGVGLIQCLSMIPGVSRSGATIMGGLSLGVERRTAAEFSFFLAIPTMLGATTLELLKHRDEIVAGASGVGFGTVAVGFVVSFVVALVVVRAFVHYISRHGFAPFAWYRIVAGVAALAWLAMR